MKRSKPEYVLFYGQYATEKSQAERGLLSLAVPASNRMRRIARSLSITGKLVLIMAPGISLSSRPKSLFCPAIVEKHRGVPVVTIPQIGLRFIGCLLSPFSAIRSLMHMARRGRVKTIIQYCYYPDAVVVSCFAKLFLGSKIVLDLEDICIPSFKDWKRSSETRAFQQLWGFFLMKVSMRLVDLTIVPTKRFIPFVWTKGKILNISGCQKVQKRGDIIRKDRKIVLLYGGAIAFEHGVDLMIAALKKLELTSHSQKFEVHICGRGEKWEWVQKEIQHLTRIQVVCHGYVSNKVFSEIYRKVDVCFVLQNPYGRHSQYKTPSKGYEALCSGKTIIVPDIGDFSDVPDEICYRLKEYTDDALAEILEQMTIDDVCNKREAAMQYSMSNWDLEMVGHRLGNTGVFE